MSVSSSTAVTVIVVGGSKASPTIALMSPLPTKIKGRTLTTLAICFTGNSWTKEQQFACLSRHCALCGRGNAPTLQLYTCHLYLHGEYLLPAVNILRVVFDTVISAHDDELLVIITENSTVIAVVWGVHDRPKLNLYRKPLAVIVKIKLNFNKKY